MFQIMEQNSLVINKKYLFPSNHQIEIIFERFPINCVYFTIYLYIGK